MAGRPYLALAEGLLARDEEALKHVIEEYGPAVLGMARRVLADASLAEEVAQDTFVTLWRRPGAFDPERGTLQAYLVTMARNKAVDLVRREQVRRRKAEEFLAQPTGRSVPDPQDILETSDLEASLKHLPSPQREAIVLAYFGGRTYREVAQELGIPEGTAKTRLRDGLKRLRKLLQESRGP
jgi:RNA polymerase sigma-70 factor (ECF subfamily)